jgi:hypothetical protein
MSGMWEPDPAWRALPGAGGPSSGGVWLASRGGGDERRWVVKRLLAPDADAGRAVLDATRAGWWRREAEVAADPSVVDGPGLVPPEFGPVEEDDEGVTVWSAETEGEPPNGLFVARSLGRFAAATRDVPPWAARDQLADRLGMAADRGGWPTLARTQLADVTDRLWQRRGHWLAACAAAPQGRVHGDAVPANFLAVRDDAVVAIDWQCFGVGPLGSDVGYFALSSRVELDVLVQAYAEGAGVPVEEVLLPARVHAVYSVVTRAEWALRQAAKGEGALAGKFNHPAVAPYLRALQRQFPAIEALL